MEAASGQTPEFGTQDLQLFSEDMLINMARSAVAPKTCELVIHELERRALEEHGDKMQTEIAFALIVAHERIIRLLEFQGSEFEDTPESED